MFLASILMVVGGYIGRRNKRRGGWISFITSFGVFNQIGFALGLAGGIIMLHQARREARTDATKVKKDTSIISKQPLTDLTSFCLCLLDAFRLHRG
jgi:hypothetical protein